MYYPYGGAQQQQNINNNMNNNMNNTQLPQQYPQEQLQGYMAPSSTAWPSYNNNTSNNNNTNNNINSGIPLYNNNSAATTTNITGGVMSNSYYDPYAPMPTSSLATNNNNSNAAINGGQDNNNNYYYQQQQTTLQQQQQQQQQQQYQQQLPQTNYNTSPITSSLQPYTGTGPVQPPHSNITSKNISLPGGNIQQEPITKPIQQQSQQMQNQNQNQKFVSTGTNSNNASVREQSLTPVGKYSRPPPKRSVDLKSAPNPRRDIPQKSPDQEYHTTSSQLPLSACGFIAIDDGNASPKFFRPTTSSVPAEDRLIKESKVCFGAVLAPLCRPLHAREEIPIISGRPPVRCHRCRGYISCHAKFTDMGRSWICVFCTMSNPVEESYFCNLDARNSRLDRLEKPELCRGSVEYDVGDYSEYALRDEKDTLIPVRPLHYLFLLDISQKAASSFLSDYVDALLKSLHEMAQLYPQCRVAFITYASTLHFYNIRHPRIPQLIVADVDNPFVPLPFTSLCWLTLGSELDLVDAFLMRVMEFAEDLHENDSAIGAAVQVAMLVLSNQHGGHIILSAHKAPQCGIGSFKLREQHLLYGTDKEKELFRPMEGFWKTTATQCAKQQISFDLHMFADQYCELVTLSQLCHVSNGRVHLFSNYDRETDATKVQAALDQTLLEEAGYAGILRVRCSTGIKVQSYHGHFMSQDPHDMDLANIQGSSTFYVEFAHEGKLEKTSHAYFQTALLYTTRAGQRRVRVHSTRMPVITTMTSVFEADLEASLIGYIHEAIGNAVNKGLRQARAAAEERVLKMLIAYRRVCTSNSTSSLLMPSRLRLIPLYVLSLLKADALVEGTTVPIDDRIQKIFHLMTIPMHQCLTYLYPSLYALHHLPSDPISGTIDNVTGKCILPGWRQLFYESITSDGVFVLCDEQARLVYLWIGNSVNAQIALELFGTENANEVGRSVFFDNFGEKIKNVLGACLMKEDGMRRLVILHEKDRAEEAFFRQLKEEHEGGFMGYDEFLVRLHREVNKAVS